MSDRRGLVISTNHTNNPNGTFSQNAIDPQMLRIALLFFDVIDCPDNQLVSIGVGQDADFLISAGVMERTCLSYQEANGTKFLDAVAWDGFARRDHLEPGIWTMAHKDGLLPGKEHTRHGRGALFQLFQALPVPDKDVALADLLEFRTQRRDELLALRIHVEEVFQTIQHAEDGPLAWSTQLTKLTASANAALRVANESPLSFRVGSIDWRVNVLPPVAAALTALSTGSPFGQALQIGIAGASPAVFVSATSGMSRWRNVPVPFSYLARVHHELMIGD